MTAIKLPDLPFPLEPSGNAPCEGSVSERTLTLTGAAGTDMFIDPAGDETPPDAGRLTGLPPDGDFTFSARVTVPFGSTFDAGVLLLHATEQRWAKLCYEYSPRSRPTAVTVVTRGTSDDCNSFETDGSPLWLRITRTGRAWAFHASADGEWWRMLRYFSLGEETGTRVGFLAQSPTGPGCTVTFDHIAFSPGAPGDLRDGS